MGTEKKHPTQHKPNEEEIVDAMFAKQRCCPFLSDGTGRSVGSVWWEKIRSAEKEERWWTRGWKKIRKWSELIAGPRWKTFLRRFNRGTGGGIGYGKFQYDPSSYARNFDEGLGQNGDFDDEIGFRSFSARYAAIPGTTKMSMDLGKDSPDFT